MDIRVSGIEIKKNRKFLNRRDKLSLENVEFMIVSNIPKAYPKAKIVFTYKKDLPFHMLLEFHVNGQQAEELKKRIEGGTLLTIEIEKYNATYKYIIKEVSSCKISENVLKIEFNGEFYKDGNRIYGHLEEFICSIENSTYTFPQLQQPQQSSVAEETSAPAVSPPQNPKAEPNVNKVSNIDHILYCSKVHYSFENYKSKGCIVEFPQNEVSEYVQFIKANKDKKIIENIKELRDCITREQLDALPKPTNLNLLQIFYVV
ncbi:MAG: hypothetical protein PG981_001181 [Wolbachia endosymbiont of Ctenocephalides orientis wCori]|nr:MAG: hypothetical protein PG981_001181 [Wolbachia endosymbiont of Ctenocephalides orientis wCori]